MIVSTGRIGKTSTLLRHNMEEEKKTTLDVISSFFKRGNKKKETHADTRNSIMTTNSLEYEEEDDEWIFLLENQIDERRENVHQISIFLIVLGIVLIYFNYFDVLFAILGKEGGPIIFRIINLGAAFVITVTGLIMWDNTKDVEN